MRPNDTRHDPKPEISHAPKQFLHEKYDETITHKGSYRGQTSWTHVDKKSIGDSGFGNSRRRNP